MKLVKRKKLPISIENKLNRLVRIHGLSNEDKEYWYDKLLLIYELEKKERKNATTRA